MRQEVVARVSVKNITSEITFWQKVRAGLCLFGWFVPLIVAVIAFFGLSVSWLDSLILVVLGELLWAAGKLYFSILVKIVKIIEKTWLRYAFFSGAGIGLTLGFHYGLLQSWMVSAVLTGVIFICILMITTVTFYSKNKSEVKISWLINRSNKVFVLIYFFVLGSVVLAPVFMIGGVHYWYRQYVTPAVRNNVLKRLNDLQQSSSSIIFDQFSESFGAYKSLQTEADVYYRDSQILKWPLTKVILASEGELRKAGWFWEKLMPGKLKLEPISLTGLVRAVYYTVFRKKEMGGSTPLMQLSKNLPTLGRKQQKLTSWKKLHLKIFAEFPRAYVLAENLSAALVMKYYLLTVYSGQGQYYGAHRMSTFFYGVLDINNLDWCQSVVIASSLPKPRLLNPVNLRECLTTPNSCSKEKMFKEWRHRQRQIAARVKTLYNVTVALDGCQKFENKLSEQAVAISQQFRTFDLHLRQWLNKDWPKNVPPAGSNGLAIYLSLQKKLTLALIKKVTEEVLSIRQYLENNEAQLAYTLIDSRTGAIISQYGGDDDKKGRRVDMAASKKPVVGSVFKLLTALVLAKYWPENLPLVNKGFPVKRRCQTNCTQQKMFVFQGTRKMVKNDHAMPEYVNLEQALTHSANIAFVFGSLYYTWFVNDKVWLEIFQIGLKQMLQEKKANMPVQDVVSYGQLFAGEAKNLQADEAVTKIYKFLRRYMGYRKHLNAQAINNSRVFAQKISCLRDMLLNPGLTDEQRTFLAEMMTGQSVKDMAGFDACMTAQAQAAASRPTTMETGTKFWNLSRLITLRQEMGLRYIAHLAQLVAGYQGQIDPVLVMTLGVSDWTTLELATLVAAVNSGKSMRPYLLEQVRSKITDKVLYGVYSQASELPWPTAKVKSYMGHVLQSGTASKAGQALTKNYPDWFKQNLAGAKTGTVQSNRGLSCVGFLGHLAGALTLSTPDNARLCQKRRRSRCLNSGQACQILFKLLSKAKADFDKEPTVVRPK